MAEAYSVVIPAYNAVATLGDALRSLASQTIRPDNVVVVDDGSTDGTAACAEAFRNVLPVTVIRQANAGGGAATNTGVAVVDTALLAFLDADDVWLPHKAAAQLALLAARAELAGVCGRASTFRGPVETPQMIGVMDIWGRTSLMIRTDVARTIGPVLAIERGDMTDWLARGRDLGFRIEMVPEITCMRRIRADSVAFGRDPEKDRDYLLVVKRALDRRRAAANGSK